MSESRSDDSLELRRIRRVLTGIFVILSVMAIFFAKVVLLPIILGVLLSLTLSPIVRSLARAGVPAALSAMLLITGLGAGVGFGAYMISGPVASWVEEAPRLGRQLQWRLSGVNETVEAVQQASEEVEKLAGSAGAQDVQKVVIEQPGLLNFAVTNLVSVASSALVALILALFLLSSGDLFYQKLVESFTKLSEKKKAVVIVRDIERKVSRYLLTITLINAGLGMAIASALTMLGVPSAHIWGVFAFLLNFLPFIGLMVGTVLVGAFSIVSFPDISYALLAPGAYLALSALEGQILTPLILGRRLELNTVAVFLTVVFWGWLWGIAGALMAVPSLVIVKVICDHVETLDVVGRFLGARTPMKSAE